MPVGNGTPRRSPPRSANCEVEVDEGVTSVDDWDWALGVSDDEVPRERASFPLRAALGGPDMDVEVDVMDGKGRMDVTGETGPPG